MSPRIEVRRTYLQMTSPGQHQRAGAPEVSFRIDRLPACPPSFFRYLYVEVGRRYHWVDRLAWSDADIRAHLQQPSVVLHVLYVEGAPAGYYELRRCEDQSVEIAYFGLMQEYLGMGLGKHLLSDAIDRAWDWGAQRVWLHTCTLDDPAALPNYLKRGLVPFKEETYQADV